MAKRLLRFLGIFNDGTIIITMIEVGFNELSFYERAASKGHAVSVFESFFQLIDSITELKIAPVRIRSSTDINTNSISDQFFCIKDWLQTLENPTRQRYLGYIAQQPLIADNPYFKHANTDVVGFGYAFENDLVSVSFSTNSVWIENEYRLTREYLPDADSDVVIEEVTVKHCVKNEEELEYSNWIQEEFGRKQATAAKELEDFNAFWANRAMVFQWLDFANEVNEQVQLFGSVNNPSFKKAMRYLMQLNQHLNLVNRGEAEIGSIPGDVSNDGETTMSMYGDERTFTCPDQVRRTFSLHSKLGDVRIYLYPMPLPENNRYIVGYIGGHLPTKKFN